MNYVEAGPVLQPFIIQPRQGRGVGLMSKKGAGMTPKSRIVGERLCISANLYSYDVRFFSVHDTAE